MNMKQKTLLQKMDALVWWSGAAGQVGQDMADDASARRHAPKRWLPLLPMAIGAGLVGAALAFPVQPLAYGAAAPAMALAAGIAVAGPLGKRALEDDEREAALRKDAFFFCLAILAFANIVGGPLLLFAAGLQDWGAERLYALAFALFLANMTWFTSLPTLYASWKLPRLADPEA